MHVCHNTSCARDAIARRKLRRRTTPIVLESTAHQDFVYSHKTKVKNACRVDRLERSCSFLVALRRIFTFAARFLLSSAHRSSAFRTAGDRMKKHPYASDNDAEGFFLERLCEELEHPDEGRRAGAHAAVCWLGRLLSLHVESPGSTPAVAQVLTAFASHRRIDIAVKEVRDRKRSDTEGDRELIN
jgi:hypothetical protein